MYHSHHNAAEQVTKGLMAPFIIEPKDRGKEPEVNAEYTLVLNDSGIGLPQLVIAKDGWPLPQPFTCDTLNVAPGERWDVVVDCNEPGAWAFHCHILIHAESAQGMFGMVTALVIQ